MSSFKKHKLDPSSSDFPHGRRKRQQHRFDRSGSRRGRNTTTTSSSSANANKNRGGGYEHVWISKSVSELMELVLYEPDWDTRHRNWSRAVEASVLYRTVLPNPPPLPASSPSAPQEEATAASIATSPFGETPWIQYCHLVATLLSWEFREGIRVVDPMGQHDGGNDDDDDRDVMMFRTEKAQELLSKICETLFTTTNTTSSSRPSGTAPSMASGTAATSSMTVLGFSGLRMDQAAVVTHIATWCLVQAEYGSWMGRRIVGRFIAQQRILWDYMPSRRKELERRKKRQIQGAATSRDDENEENEVDLTTDGATLATTTTSSAATPYVVTLTHDVLHLVEESALLRSIEPDFISHHFTAAGRLASAEPEEKETSDTDDDDDDRDNEEETPQPEEEEETEDLGTTVAAGVGSYETALSGWVFLHRALEFLLGLVSAPPYRSVVLPYLDSIHFLVRARRALRTIPVVQGPSPWQENLILAQQLLDRLHERINSFVETVSGSVEVRAMFHERANIVQKFCHRYYADQLPDVVYAGVGVLCQPDPLRRSLGGFPDHDLYELLYKMRLVESNASQSLSTFPLLATKTYPRDLLMAILEEYLTIPPDPLEKLQQYPIYPTETLLWDFAQIPPSHSGLLPASHVLSLPKLPARYLSFADYLWRNFELTRLESAYEIRSDLVQAIRRLQPVVRQLSTYDADGADMDDPQPELRTEFAGWARMALELDGALSVVKVVKPHIGQEFPAKVLAEIKIDLVHCGESIRQEWDSLSEFDNLFLVGVDAQQMNGQPAPLLRDYHSQYGGGYRMHDSGHDRRIPDEDDRTFPQRFGIVRVRGCMVVQIKDENDSILNETGAGESRQAKAVGTKRTFLVALDPAQYSQDMQSEQGTGLYQSLNLVIRRHGRENNFKAVLETIRGLMAGMGSIHRVLPSWLQSVQLGRTDPTEATYKSATIRTYAKTTPGVPGLDSYLDFADTFLDEEHVRASFGSRQVVLDKQENNENAEKNTDVTKMRSNYRLRFLEKEGTTMVEAIPYPFSDNKTGNTIRFTPRQVEAIRSGLSPGLSVIVGPPGTGKTDVAVQIIASLYHSFPTQRTVVITHSNAALNDIFEKVVTRQSIDERYLLRLGSGERDLQTESTHDFTKIGRVSYSFARRAKLLEEVQLMSESLGISGKAERGPDGSPSYTCETAEYFRLRQVEYRIRTFEREVRTLQLSPDSDVTSVFPFSSYFGLVPDNKSVSLSEAGVYFSRLHALFDELAEYRPLELLRSQRQRADYLLMKQARVVAMTCTHAAIARSHLIQLGFEYDNLVIEEAGQMTEIETFIPLLLQRGEADATTASRLKRICLMGDHNQLPPVIKNLSFARYNNLDQSMFARLIRLGVPYIQFDRQGRARPEISRLYSWRYNGLGNLAHVEQSERFRVANPGFAYTYQAINVEDFHGKGETTPAAHYYQNLGEAEYAVALFQYMVLIGYSPQSISLLTTYNGQKELLDAVLAERCGEGTPLEGVRPRAVSTVDQYQGQQNDYIILSLVRTETVGHIRDVRRLVVALSRGRLGLYLLCRLDLFATVPELKRAFDYFVTDRPQKLQLVLGENCSSCNRQVSDEMQPDQLFQVEDVTHMAAMVAEMSQVLFEDT